MERNNLAREEYFHAIKKYFSKDYSHKAIIHMLEKKYGVQISLRNLSRILSKNNLRRKNIVESPAEQILLAIFLEIQGSGGKLGYRSLWSKIRNVYQLKVKQKTVMFMLRELDPDGVEARSRYRLKRRVYNVPGPDYVWHSDNYDKLKRYGFPMYGFIDGYSKKVLFIGLSSSNNDPEVIANYFLKTVKKHKLLPTILRTDKGTEATVMGELQIILRLDHKDDHAGLKSHKRGRSVHNQRIESYWRQLREHLMDFYINLFKLMENDGIVDVSDPVHIECLRFCYEKVIKEEMELTRKEWNTHHIRKQKNRDIPGGKPNEMFHWPEKSGGEDCRKSVNLNHVDIFLTEFTKEIQLCSPDFIKLVEFLIPGTRRPTTNEEAFVLYETILEKIHSTHREFQAIE